MKIESLDSTYLFTFGDGPTAVRRVRFIALESETINVVRYSIQHLNLCGASAMKLSFMWSSKKIPV